MSYVIFQINTDLLVIYQVSTFLHKGLYIYIYFEKILVLFIANVFRKIHFIPHFHYFQQLVRFVIFQINTKFVKNQLKSIFTQDNLHLSLVLRKKSALYRRNFPKQPLLQNIYQLSLLVTSAIFQTNSGLISQRNINIFTLHCKIFPKHPPFTTISLFSTVFEVCNFSNKY